jgi:hypothetical protein
MLNVVMLSVVMLSVVMLSVVMLSVVMLSVMPPPDGHAIVNVYLLSDIYLYKKQSTIVIMNLGNLLFRNKL